MGRARAFLLAALGAGLGAVAFVVLPDLARTPPSVRTVFVPSPPPSVTVTDTLRRGQTLGQLFDRLGYDGTEVQDAINLVRRFRNPRTLRPGTVVEITSGLAAGPTADGRPLVEGAPSYILLRPDPDSELVLEASEAGWLGRLDSVRVVKDTLRVAGLIESNLYDARLSGDTAGVDAAGAHQMVWALSEVLAWRIDFYRDVRVGDAYRALVEREVRPDGTVRGIRVLATEFRNADRLIAAVRFVGPDGRPSYYDENGESVRRAFLLAPLELRRITSSFGRRFHPVLRRYRPHLGTDYGAPTGTPVQATGDGVVTRAGRWGGYGRMVEIRHKNGITTRYAHLSRIGVRSGQRVTQGQIIGRVGSTGLATGPHLHYEFLRHGRPQNPARLNLPPAEPVPEASKPAFAAQRDRVMGRLAELELPMLTRLADGRRGESPGE